MTNTIDSTLIQIGNQYGKFPKTHIVKISELLVTLFYNACTE